MKKILLILFLTILLNSATKAETIAPDCTYKGIPLYGKVQVVNSFEDFKVKRVTSGLEDLKVKEVSYFPNSCGKWQFVSTFPDFKIKYVDSFEDFKIRFVDYFEGI